MSFEFTIIDGSKTPRTISTTKQYVELWAFKKPNRPETYAYCTWYNNALRIRLISAAKKNELESQGLKLYHGSKVSEAARRRLQLLRQPWRRTFTGGRQRAKDRRKYTQRDPPALGSS